MNDPRLRHLLEHPPRDPERTAQPAFTAAVMARLPSSAPSTTLVDRHSGGAWWYGIAVAIMATFVLPLDPASVIGDWSRLIDADLVIELIAASAILAAALPAFAGLRSIRS